MAIITQKVLFGWEEIENLCDLERLDLVLRYLPDEELMRHLEQDRGWGRDDYPVRAVWNSLLAGVVYQHVSVESLRRELSRNGQLRSMCGFDPARGKLAVPPAYIYSRFFILLFDHSKLIEAMFENLVEQLRVELPDFGKHLALDSKAVASLTNRRSEDAPSSPDGRRDLDADLGVKQYHGVGSDGTAWEKIVKWFGYKVHLIVDADYELPVAYEVTKASASDVVAGRQLLERLSQRHGELTKGTGALMADKGYDDTVFITNLWDNHEIKPIIDIRNMWKDTEATKLVNGYTNLVYDYKGTVFCYDLTTGEKREMAFGGFEKDRGTLRYRCPAVHYGCTCPGRKTCPIRKSVRIPLDQDCRVFTPIARSSYQWNKLYKKRTAVERVNSRLDVSFGFEHHFIRGQSKMKTRIGLAMIVMLAIAVGRIKQKQTDRLRSLVRAA